MTARRRERDLADPRRQRRRVEQVARVQERGEQDDRRPGEPGHDVADGRELRGAGEGEDAHRHRLDRREPGRSRRQAVDEPEAGGRGGDPEGAAEELSPGGVDRRRGGARSDQRRNVFPQVPSQTTNTACFSAAYPAAWSRPGQPFVGHFQTHQRSLRVERGRLGGERRAPGLRARSRGGRSRSPRDRPRSRSCTGSSG